MKVKSFLLGIAIAQALFGAVLYWVGAMDFEQTVVRLLVAIALLVLADAI